MVNNYKKDEEATKFSWKNMSRMLEFIKPYKKELFISFFIGIISSLLLLVIPKLMAYAIDVSFVNKNFIPIVLLSFIMLGIVLLSVFFTKIQRDKMIIALDKVSYDIKAEIFKKLQYLPNNYFDTRSHGKIYTRATSYPDDVAGIFCYVIVQGLLDIVNLIFVIVFMLITNTSLALISIISEIGRAHV